MENKNSIARKLDGAFLLIGAAAENPDHKVRGIFEFNQEPWTNDNSFVLLFLGE